MGPSEIPVVPINKTIDLLYQNVQHTHSSRLHNIAQCHICNERFLSGKHPERPVTLRCGHIFGEACILKWISPLSDTRGRNSCPLCRTSILKLSTLDLPMTRKLISLPIMAADRFGDGLLLMVFLLLIKTVGKSWRVSTCSFIQNAVRRFYESS